MNTQKIKMALTAGLINQHTNTNVLPNVKQLMGNFAEEVGSFLGLSQLGNAVLNRNTIHEVYALRYEKCTLNLELISHPQTSVQTVQRFQLH